MTSSTTTPAILRKRWPQSIDTFKRGRNNILPNSGGQVRSTIMIEMDAVGGLLPCASLRRWLMAVLLCGGLWTPVAAGPARAGEPESGTATLTAIEDLGQPLFALPSLDGATHDLAQHRGRMVLVHF